MPKIGQPKNSKAETFLEFVLTELMGTPAFTSCGRSFWNCPFHDDENPSFCTLPPRIAFKDRYKCLSCGVWGDEMDLLKHFFPNDNYDQRLDQRKTLRQRYDQFLLRGDREPRNRYQTTQLDREEEQEVTLTYFRRHYEECLASTADETYQELSQKRHLPLQTLKRHGLAYDTQTGCWLIPLKSPSGKVVNLCRYYLDSGKKFNLPKLPVGLYGLDQLSDDPTKTILLCEGPFDYFVLDHLLRSRKLRHRYDILAVPGANTFKEQWAAFFRDRKVICLLDNDEAGHRGQDRVAKILRKANVGATVNVLIWPEGTPDKYDLSDLIRDDPNVPIVQFIREHT